MPSPNNGANLTDFSDSARPHKPKTQWSKSLGVLVLTAALSLGMPSIAQAAPEPTPTPSVPITDETTDAVPTETSAPVGGVTPTAEPSEEALPAPDDNASATTPEATVPAESPEPSATEESDRDAQREGRVSGSDRFATAVQLSKSSYPGTAPVVVIATGEKFADALSAGPAAVKLGGPLLLTYRDDVPASVVTEIKRLKPTRIQIVGGTSAVSLRVEQQLTSLAPVIDRFAGPDRFETSRKVLACAWSSNYQHTKTTDGTGKNWLTCPYGRVVADTVYLATGSNFPDALSAGAAAGRIKAAVVLVPQERSSTYEYGLYIHRERIADVRIVGGVNAVGSSWEKWLKDRGVESVRLAGADRFATAVAVNNHGFRSASSAYLATGSNFPDALAGAAAAGKRGAPLYLSQGHCVPSSVLNDMARLGVASTSKVTLIGGKNALNANVERLGRC